MVESAKKVRRKQLIYSLGGFFAVSGIFAFGLWLSDPNRDRANLRAASADERTVESNYTLSSNTAATTEDILIKKLDQNFEQMRMKNKELEKELSSLRREMKRISQEKNTGSISSPATNLSALPLPSRPTPLPSVRVARNVNTEAIKPVPPKSPALKEPQSPVEPVEPVDIVQVSIEAEKDKLKHVSHYLPAGSLATVVLVSGMDAPTGGQAQSNPMPVLMRLVNDGKLPNFFESGIKDCHILGAGYGDIAAERVYIRLEKITCVMHNGEIIETKVKGFVTGEDGKNGFRGRLVSKQGALLAKSLFAGIFSGMGDAVAAQSKQVSTNPLGSVQTIDPGKIVQSGLGEGVSGSLDRLSAYYLDRANEVFPILEVASERIGEIIFSSGAELGTDIYKGNRSDS